ncbi:MAG TPA: hypothetical protein VEO74_16795 [Thermoanaerobaculia bacterium]|nr:hypothetical protein [Thermoanaerobaculia bacterium]
MRRATLAAILLVGVLLRLRGLFTDFWLDEIWGLRIALAAPSGLALITQIHQDTNHPLVSIVMHAIGPVRHWEWYRVFPFLCGVGTIVAVRERTYRILAALSFPLIVYSSEARGYAPAAFFLVLAYRLTRGGETPPLRPAGRRRDFFFGVAIVLALLSHLSAVAVYLGFFSVDAVRRDWKKHILPIAFGAWYYVVKVRHLVAGGGPRWSPTPFAIAIAVATFAIVAIEIVRRVRARDLDALFFGVALVVGPAIAAASYRCPCVLPRHFLVCVPFVLMLFASFFERVRWGMAVFIVVNVIQIIPFMRYGRGQYDRALHDVGPIVSGDSELRDRMLIDFYNPSLRYVPRSQNPEWLLIEDTTPGPGYTLWREYPYGGISGWTWYVYRLSKPDSIQR